MNTKITVSIITPVYNGSRTIGETIESVLAQTHGNWEHIIVDDGSRDHTALVIKHYQDSRIRYFYQENAGRSAARNVGLERATGNYILFLDADDWLLPAALAQHVQYLQQRSDYDVSVSDGYFCTDQRRLLVRFSERRRSKVEDGDVLEAMVTSRGLLPGAAHCALVRTSAVHDHNLCFEENLTIAEDWLFWTELASHVQFGFFDAVTCLYRWHSENTTLSASAEFSLNQLWRAYQQIVGAPYFTRISGNGRWKVFYDILINVLVGQPEQRSAVFRLPAFSGLTSGQQARLLRLTATQQIIESGPDHLATNWITRAGVLTGRDLKTETIYALLHISPAFGRHALLAWRTLWKKRQSDPLLQYLDQTLGS